MRPQFLTVPEELIEVADNAIAFFSQFGYSVKIEHAATGYPYTPTLVCKRSPISLIVEVVDSVPRDRIHEWVSYAKSCFRGTRVAVILPAGTTVPTADQSLLADLGVGLYVSEQASLREMIATSDLAVRIELPQLTRYSNRVRRVLGGSFEQIHRGQWREGFEDACVALEEEARKYLKRHIASGRVAVVSSRGKIHTPTPAAVDRMSMGQLKDMFLDIQSPNATDSKVAEILKRLNPDRIRVAHKKKSSRAEAALRTNVGKQMWTIVAGVKLLVDP